MASLGRMSPGDIGATAGISLALMNGVRPEPAFGACSWRCADGESCFESRACGALVRREAGSGK
jgi:hypothetical protein